MPIAKFNKVVLNLLGASPTTKNVKDGPPFAGIEFNEGGDEEADEENIKVATTNIAVNEVISDERGERAAECWGLKDPVPQNLFLGHDPYLLPRD